MLTTQYVPNEWRLMILASSGHWWGNRWSVRCDKGRISYCRLSDQSTFNNDEILAPHQVEEDRVWDLWCRISSQLAYHLRSGRCCRTISFQTLFLEGFNTGIPRSGWDPPGCSWIWKLCKFIYHGLNELFELMGERWYHIIRRYDFYFIHNYLNLHTTWTTSDSVLRHVVEYAGLTKHFTKMPTLASRHCPYNLSF